MYGLSNLLFTHKYTIFLLKVRMKTMFYISCKCGGITVLNILIVSDKSPLQHINNVVIYAYANDSNERRNRETA